MRRHQPLARSTPQSPSLDDDADDADDVRARQEVPRQTITYDRGNSTAPYAVRGRFTSRPSKSHPKVLNGGGVDEVSGWWPLRINCYSILPSEVCRFAGPWIQTFHHWSTFIMSFWETDSPSKFIIKQLQIASKYCLLMVADMDLFDCCTLPKKEIEWKWEQKVLGTKWNLSNR